MNLDRDLACCIFNDKKLLASLTAFIKKPKSLDEEEDSSDKEIEVKKRKIR